MAFSLHIQSKQKLNFRTSQRNRQKLGLVMQVSSEFDNFILLIDLNSEPSESAVRYFFRSIAVKTLLKIILVLQIWKSPLV